MRKIIVIALFALNLFSQVLNVNEAFNIKTTNDDQGISFDFKFGKDIYIYNDTFHLDLNGKNINEYLNMPKFEISNNHKIIFNGFNLFVPKNLILELIMDKKESKIDLFYQGCAKNGVCYRPQMKSFNIKNENGKITLTENKEIKQNNNSKIQTQSQEQQIASSLSSQKFIFSAFTFFWYGILLSLTPCVFPMIPILSSIIVSRNTTTDDKKGSFKVSLIYVFAMALAYALAGIGASYLGSSISGALQNIWVLGITAVIFIILAFSMFGFYEIRLPNLIKQNQKKGMFSVFVMGFTSALIVSPCVAAPLAGALLYIAQSGNPIYGGIMLFIMGFAMGIPLLLIGLGSTKFLPKPGLWMDNIKMIFGFLMLLMAVWIVARLLPSFYEMTGYAIIGIFASVYFGAFEPANKGLTKFKKSILLLIFIYSTMLIIGAFTGSKNIFNPLDSLNTSGIKKEEINLKYAKNLDELKSIIKNSNKPLIIDFWASWCVSCLELDKYTFSNEEVKKRLENFEVIKIDVTQNTKENNEMLKEFGLISPPALLIFNKGQEIRSKRIIGFIVPKDFLKQIDNI